MATVPAPVASWMATYLRNIGMASHSSMDNDIMRRGLRCLTVRQLKALWDAVEPFTTAKRPSSHAKKDVWVDRLRRVFYVDSSCSQADATIVDQLPWGTTGATTSAVPVRGQQCSPQQDHARSGAAGEAAATAATQPPTAALPQHQTGVNRGPQCLARRPQANAAHVPAPPLPTRPQANAIRGPQTLARKPQKNVPRGPQSLATRPQTNTAQTNTTQQARAAAAAAAASRQVQNMAIQQAAAAAASRQVQNMAIQQAAAAALAQFGPGITVQTVRPPYRYIDWMAPTVQIAPSAAQAPRPSSQPVPSPASQPAMKKIKKEPGAPVHQEPVMDESHWETRPKNAQESSMVEQLRQMGFTDMREMLAGIRHVQAADMASQVESAMMWIVSQREETEEARNVDAARARSEALRAEQARLRKEAAHNRLWSSSMDDWAEQADLFHGSVILKEARHCLETLIFDNKEYKEKLIRFLELEKKARKWYGTSVPWCFLCDLCERWKSLSEVDLIKCIESDATALETAMYSLSEQKGGVPIIFLEARCNAEKSGRPVSPGRGPTSADDSDDDVIVLKEVFASAEAPSMNSVSRNGKKCELIELL